MCSFMVRMIAVMALAGTSAASAATLPLILQVEPAPLAWGDSRLADMLTTALSRNPDLRVILPETGSPQFPSFPRDRNNIDSLLEWGMEIGGRYLMIVTVDREGMERRKTFSVPVLFHRWETIAVIAGELRLLDLQKRRLLLAEPFEEKIPAARQFQSSAEDNSADPALHVSAAEKSDLFKSLESRLVERLKDKISRYTRGR